MAFPPTHPALAPAVAETMAEWREVPGEPSEHLHKRMKRAPQSSTKRSYANPASQTESPAHSVPPLALPGIDLEEVIDLEEECTGGAAADPGVAAASGSTEAPPPPLGGGAGYGGGGDGGDGGGGGDGGDGNDGGHAGGKGKGKSKKGKGKCMAKGKGKGAYAAKGKGKAAVADPWSPPFRQCKMCGYPTHLKREFWGTYIQRGCILCKTWDFHYPRRH